MPIFTRVNNSISGLLKKDHLLRCIVATLVRRVNTHASALAPRASHLDLFEQPSPLRSCIKSYSMKNPANGPLKLLAVLAILLAGLPAFAGWSIDFSRRESQMRSFIGDSGLNNTPAAQNSREPASFGAAILSNFTDSAMPTQDIVILNTEQGFIPSTIHVRKGNQYRIVVVNVNDKQRNVSFIMDAFNEHDATFYGKIKSFYIHPQKDGVYSYESPETSAQGQLIVYPSAAAPSMAPNAVPISLDVRAPASAPSDDSAAVPMHGE